MPSSGTLAVGLDVCGGLGLGAASLIPGAPTVRVRVIDRQSRESLDDIATVVFVPADDTAPFRVALEGSASRSTEAPGGGDAKLAALQTMPARRFHVKASAPGYAQLNYLDGPVSLYYEHVVVDASGVPQKEICVEMDKRVASLFLSCTDARTGESLPLAKVRLTRRPDAATSDARGRGREPP